METNLDLDDIQGLLARGYSELKEASYLMLQYVDVVKAKQWLLILADSISIASRKETEFAMQIAFTYQGIIKMIDEHKITQPFSREFCDGMVTEARKRILGDLECNGHDKWDWGSPKNDDIHAVLMIYAKDVAQLNIKYESIANELQGNGFKIIIKLDTGCNIPDNKEHFGFVDGISQPKIKGFEKAGSTVQKKKSEIDEYNNVMAGEFILGHNNEYGMKSSIPAYNDGSKKFEIGKNGSYMVFRQLEQDVKRFWNFIKETAATNPHFKPGDEIHIASKMMGRFPNGNPLTLTKNESDKPLNNDEINNFLFRANDADGFGCPIGSHIRKSNPRDGIDNNAVVSIEVAKRHRILRRGRSYGEALDPITMNHDKMLESTNTDKRGLYFICFNANIARQFEFIQQTWDNNPKFDGLHYDIDPIIGFTYMEDNYSLGNFTIQACPVRKKVNNIPQFVFVKGGAYFFMPGIKALKFIASN